MSSKIRKLLIAPYFGDFPEWMDKFKEQLPRLQEAGYDILIDTDLEGFKKRVKEKLGIEAPIKYGVPKIFDYRCTFGVLYAKELEGYDFWGTVDFDVVFGDVGHWLTDAFLSSLDVFSNHDTYVCGFFSLYRNIPEVNELFKKHPYWQDFMTEERVNGWVESDYSHYLESSGLEYAYRSWQGDPYNPPFNLKMENGKLYQDGIEIAMLHFRRSKVWPLKDL